MRTADKWLLLLFNLLSQSWSRVHGLDTVWGTQQGLILDTCSEQRNGGIACRTRVCTLKLKKLSLSPAWPHTVMASHTLLDLDTEPSVFPNTP